jgi:conserved hypothetical protein
MTQSKNVKLKLYISIVQWVFLFIASMIINILSIILAPFIAIYSLYKPVPKWLNWFLTHDCGINGDSDHLKRWVGESKWRKFLRRTAWLWRNKGYTFDYDVCGRVIGNTLVNKGDPETSDAKKAGYIFQYDENGTWEYYLVKPYSFKKDKCLRLRFGWKIADGLVGTGSKMMLATSIGIWKDFVSRPDTVPVEETKETTEVKEDLNGFNGTKE